MDLETLLGERGTLRRNITVSLIVALIVALIVGLFRRFNNEIRAIPGIGGVVDFIAPGLAVPEYGGDFEFTPGDRSISIPPNVPPEININRGGGGSCCNSCGPGSTSRGGVLDSLTEYLLRQNDRNNNQGPGYLDPVPMPCFPRTDWEAFARHPANSDLMRAYNNMTSRDFQWIASYGFPGTLAGYAQYMAEFDPHFSRAVREGRRPQPQGFTTC